MVFTLDKIKGLITLYTDIPTTDIHENSNLIYDLGLTSFDIVSLNIMLENEINRVIPFDELLKINTIKELLLYMNDAVK